MNDITPIWVVWLVSALATWRLARLVTEDVITAPIRDTVIRVAYWVVRRRPGERSGRQLYDKDPTMYVNEVDEQPPKLAVLVTCIACASVWTGALVYVLADRWPEVWLPVAGIAALSAASLVLEAVTDR